jgi:glycyl-tRNA synthetase
MKESKFNKILDIAKRRGFFWQSALVHEPISGFYDYGHVGTLIKRRFENLWRRYFIGLDDNFYEIESSCILPKSVFQASGHLKHFVDPVVKCGKCGTTERADHILEDELKESFEGLTPRDLMELIRKHKIKCPKCRGPLCEAGELNMMFPVGVGTGKDAKAGFLTAETAQGAYLNFKLEFEALRKRLPFGLAIIGKAFRNEISPRNALIRMREFTQAELQIFFDPREINQHPRFKEVAGYKLRGFAVKNRGGDRTEEVACRDAVSRLGLPKFCVYYMARVQQFYIDVLNVPKNMFRFRELSEEEKAFYNRYHWDVELNLESLGGWKEIAGCHYRTDYDLKGHEKVSGKDMSVNVEGRVITPHVYELSFGVDRDIYALLEIFLREDKERTWFELPRVVSPFDAVIFPLVRKDGLPEKAREVQKLLEKQGFSTFFDSTGSIGRMYRRVDEIGQAASLTIDYESLKRDDCTLRDRDTMKQIRVKIKDLPSVLREFMNGKGIREMGKVIN